VRITHNLDRIESGAGSGTNHLHQEKT
jgi:hypothetical protein